MIFAYRPMSIESLPTPPPRLLTAAPQKNIRSAFVPALLTCGRILFVVLWSRTFLGRLRLRMGKIKTSGSCSKNLYLFKC